MTKQHGSPTAPFAAMVYARKISIYLHCALPSGIIIIDMDSSITLPFNAVCAANELLDVDVSDATITRRLAPLDDCDEQQCQTR